MKSTLCPNCGNTDPAFVFSDLVSWGCNKCFYYEDTYSGPSFLPNDYGIRLVQKDYEQARYLSSFR